jgi:hypothetical protein
LHLPKRAAFKKDHTASPWSSIDMIVVMWPSQKIRPRFPEARSHTVHHPTRAAVVGPYRHDHRRCQNFRQLRLHHQRAPSDQIYSPEQAVFGRLCLILWPKHEVIFKPALFRGAADYPGDPVPMQFSGATKLVVLFRVPKFPRSNETGEHHCRS